MIQLSPKQAGVLAEAAKVLQILAKQVTPKPEEEPTEEEGEDEDEDDEDDEEESATHGAYKP